MQQPIPDERFGYMDGVRSAGLKRKMKEDEESSSVTILAELYNLAKAYKQNT
jgi:hypothetical protein